MAREAQESDTLLVADIMVKPGENRVQQVSSNKLKEEGIAALSRSASAVADRPAAKIAHNVYTAENSAHITIMTVQGEFTASMLPAGVPVIDHLAAWTSVTPGWDSVSPIVAELCSLRMPATAELSHPEVLEIALGTATDAEYAHAIDWVRCKHQETQKRYGVLLPAANVECVLLKATRNFQTTELLLSNIVLKAEERDPTFELQPEPGHSISPGKAVSMPVLFMYGSVGWQLHIRLAAGHSPDSKNITFLCNNPLPQLYLDLISSLEPAVGMGIEKYYQDFFSTVAAFWPNHGTKPAAPIELTRITMLAGCTISHATVIQLVYTFLGGYLCKDWRVSTGNHLWSQPYTTLPTSLRCYLHGNIQQVAITAWVAATVWVAHLFPDSTLATRATTLTPTGLLIWWTEAVVKGLMRQGPWNDPQPGYVTRREEAIQRAGVPRTEPIHAVLRLCPSWPAITSGGCREFHTAGVFLRNNYTILHFTGLQTGHDIWPNYDNTARAHMFTLGLDGDALPPPSTAPSQHSARFVPAKYKHSFLSLKPEEITRELLFDAATDMSLAKRPVFLLYHKANMERAVAALDLWEREPRRIIDMLGLGRGSMIIRDCRELLWSVGRLRARDPAWPDPYHLEKWAANKMQRMVTYVKLQWLTQAEAARQQLAREAILQESARLLSTKDLPAVTAIGPLLTTIGHQITGSTISPTGRSRSARRRKRRELTALEAAGLRTPGPNAQSGKVFGKEVATGKRPGQQARTDPVAAPSTASTSSATPALGETPVRKQSCLQAPTNPAEIPLASVSPLALYLPGTEAISEDDSTLLVKTERPDTPLHQQPIPVIESHSVHYVSAIPIHTPRSILSSPSSSHTDPSLGVRFATPSPPPTSQKELCDNISTAHGCAHSYSHSREPQPTPKREVSPLPPREVAEWEEPRDESENKVITIGITTSEPTGLQAPILTKPVFKRRK